MTSHRWPKYGVMRFARANPWQSTSKKRASTRCRVSRQCALYAPVCDNPISTVFCTCHAYPVHTNCYRIPVGATRRLRQPIKLPSWHHGSSCGAPCTLAPETEAVAGRCVNRIGMLRSSLRGDRTSIMAWHRQTQSIWIPLVLYTYFGTWGHLVFCSCASAH